MSKAEERLAALGLELPAAAAPVANYVGYTVSGKTVYVSGQLPFKDGQVLVAGRLGAGVSIEDGYAAGRQCGLNILAHLKAACGGDLDRVARVLRLGGFVNSTPEFTDAPKCVNGASDLMVAVFGDAGKHARAAVGVASLPAGAAVEVDAIVELK
ncbi:MAG: RidA family protein [Betaproteobacteria bacterium]|nr:RidA family protein [Betaproteobacteria bacterium]